VILNGASHAERLGAPGGIQQRDGGVLRTRGALRIVAQRSVSRPGAQIFRSACPGWTLVPWGVWQDRRSGTPRRMPDANVRSRELLRPLQH
jgi:hypothetical protein